MLKLNVGLSRKIGEPNYGSRGASVNIEAEVDSTTVRDPAVLKNRIRRLFQLAKESINEELHRDSDTSASTTSNPNRNRNGSKTQSRRPATNSQVRALKAICERSRTNLVALIRDRFSYNRAEDLSLSEASKLIDELKRPAPQKGGSG